MQTNFAGNHATATIAGKPEINKLDLLCTDKEASEILGCARSTFWRWVAEGIVSKPLKIGGMSRWKQSEILAVIAKADAAREAA
jgi:predicted DNA-binding transcriptional regulator AlpA